LPAFDSLNSESSDVIVDNAPNLPLYPTVSGALNAQQTSRLNQVVMAWRNACIALDGLYFYHDIQNVQWAVDNVALGGTIVLKAFLDASGKVIPFDFGYSNQLRVRRDLNLLGEALSRNAPPAPGKPGGWIDSGTTIKGGHRALLGESPSYVPSVTIKDIIFYKSFNQAIHVITSKGYNEISGCRFMNIMQGYTGVTSGVYGAFNLLIHGGTNATAINLLGGKIRISNNFFGKVYMPDGVTEADGINNVMHYTNCNADFDITENEIEDCAWTGFTIANVKGFTRIYRNKITKTRSFNDGVAISVGMAPSNALFVTNEAYEGSAEIFDNEIIIGSPTAPWSTTNSHAILISRYPTTQQFPGFPNLPPHIEEPEDLYYLISWNRITMHRNPSSGGLNPSAISCLGSAKNVTVKNNTLNGEAAVGIMLTKSLPAFMAPANEDAFVTNNSFHGNNLEGFNAGIAQVYLDQFTKDNFFGPGTDPYTGINYHGNIFGPLQLLYDQNPILPNGQRNQYYHTLLTLGVYVDNGQNNACQHNDFTQSNAQGTVNGLEVGIPNPYPDEWPGVIDYVACISLGSTSSYAKVYEHPKLGTKYFPTGTSMCNQISWDQNSTNVVHLWDTYCVGNPPNKNLDEIWARWEAHQAWQNQSVSNQPPEVTWPEYQDMTALGYVWDESQQCWVDEFGNRIQ
jgi:hypothetical protein